MKLPKNVKDISGLRVGRLVVREFSHLQNHKAIWFCDCDCGSRAIPKYGYALTSKNPTQSCGCLQREIAKENMKKVTIKIIHAQKVLFVKTVAAWLSLREPAPTTAITVPIAYRASTWTQSRGTAPLTVEASWSR